MFRFVDYAKHAGRIVCGANFLRTVVQRNLDEKDRQILELLQENSRLSNRLLATRVRLAESTTLERVRRLEREGVIRGAHIEVDLEACGGAVQAMVMVRLAKHSRRTIEGFKKILFQQREVVASYLIGGQHDFLVHVVAPDTSYLKNFVLDRITTRPEVVNVETVLIFDFERNPVIPSFTVRSRSFRD